MCVCVCVLALTLVVSSVPIDLSQYMLDVVKMVAPYVSSQNPETRRDAQNLLVALFKQSSDPAAAKAACEILATALKSIA